jgi:hypothetical protein
MDYGRSAARSFQPPRRRPRSSATVVGRLFGVASAEGAPFLVVGVEQTSAGPAVESPSNVVHVLNGGAHTVAPAAKTDSIGGDRTPGGVTVPATSAQNRTTEANLHAYSADRAAAAML